MNRTVLFFVLAAVYSEAGVAVAQTVRADAGLSVVQTAPQGEVASLAEASEIRVVFSEAMVTLGRIPGRIQPGFFRMSPSVPGTFR